MNNGSIKPVYVYNNQAYAQFNNGLYPLQTTTDIIGNLRLQRVQNSKPLVFPSPLKISNINSVKFTNMVKTGGWFGFGKNVINTSSHKASFLRAVANNMQNIVTPNQSKTLLEYMPRSIKDGISFLIQKKDQTPVIDVKDETGLSEKDKATLKQKVGDKAYNFIIENWKKLSNSNKNVFKVVGTSVSSGFLLYGAEILLNIGWVATTGTPPPAAIGMVLRSGKILTGVL